MRILQIAPRIPYPLTEGGSIGIFNITRQLARRGAEIYFVAVTGRRSAVVPEELRDICRDVLVEQVSNGYGFKTALKNLGSPVPVNIEKYHSERALAKILKFARESRIDLVHTDHLHTAYYGLALKESLCVPAVLREHNLELKIMERTSLNAVNPFLRVYAKFQLKKFLTYEPSICARFDRCIMITEQDRTSLLSMDDSVSSTVIPAGVDTEFFGPSESLGDEDTIAFVGSLDWLPNVDGLKWFVERALPRVLRARPAARFYIYGKNASSDVRRLHDGKNVIFKGFAEDVREVFRNSRVIVVPLLVGSGIRIKILEAMAAGKPVVTTSIGCEGIRTTEGENIMIGDTPALFADKVVELLEDETLCRRLGGTAASSAAVNYSWDKVGEMFWQIYTDLLGNGGSSRNQPRGE